MVFSEEKAAELVRLMPLLGKIIESLGQDTMPVASTRESPQETLQRALGKSSVVAKGDAREQLVLGIRGTKSLITQMELAEDPQHNDSLCSLRKALMEKETALKKVQDDAPTAASTRMAL